MAEFCYVIEKIEWAEDLDGSHEYWEDRHICRVCKTYESAKDFVESNSASTDYPMKWWGERRYSGHLRDSEMAEGLKYVLHYIPVF